MEFYGQDISYPNAAVKSYTIDNIGLEVSLKNVTRNGMDIILNGKDSGIGVVFGGEIQKGNETHNGVRAYTVDKQLHNYRVNISELIEDLF